MAPPSISLPSDEKQFDRVGYVTVTDVESPKSDSTPPDQIPKIKGALSDLLWGALLPCVPVIIVSTSLLAMIFYHRVPIDPGWEMLQTSTAGETDGFKMTSRVMSFATSGGSPAYYIRFSPTVLAAIASWTSKIIPFITGSSMAVVAFFAGRRILDATKSSNPDQLPTPHQMSILINLLRGADIAPLRDTILYRWQNHEHLVQPIPMAFGALSFIVFITLLIGAADTWFAASTKPMNIALLERHVDPVYTYGRDIDPSLCASTSLEEAPCPGNSSARCGYPCSVEVWNYTIDGAKSMKQGIKGAQQSAETLLGNSVVGSIQNYTQSNGQQYFYLGDTGAGENLDFVANTTAVTTQCEMITPDCQFNSSVPGFSCPGYQSPSFTYSGSVGVDPTMAVAPSNMSMVGIQFFLDANRQNPIGFGNQSTQLFSAQNPIHFLTWSKGFPPIDTTSETFQDMMDGNYLQLDSSGDNVFIINCSATIYKSTFVWVNGSIPQDRQNQSFYSELAPDAYGAMVSAPFAIDSALGHLALQSAAALAAYKTKPQDVADKFSEEFSRAAVALTAGIMSPILNSLEQSRNNTELLTRVPKIPLYFLIGLKAFYALTSILIALLAWFVTGPAEAQEVKARLTVEGLTTGLFEPSAAQERAVEKLEQLYGEHKNTDTANQANNKVGIKQTEEGGWVWVASGMVLKAWTNLGIGGVVGTVVDNAASDGAFGAPGKDYEVLKKII